MHGARCASVQRKLTDAAYLSLVLQVQVCRIIPPLVPHLENAMKRWCCFAAALTLLAPSMRAESKNPADYPLRVHIFRRNETTFYHNRQAEEAKGEGRANLFEGGEPKGIDFQFECDQKLQTSSGFETFPAKWRKQNAELGDSAAAVRQTGELRHLPFESGVEGFHLRSAQRQSIDRTCGGF